MAESKQTQELLMRVRAGDASAVNALMDLHRQRLKKLIVYRLDPCLASRVDPSDIVQETLAEASQQLSQFVNNTNLMFYAWLRTVAVNRLVDLRRQHIHAQRRSVEREVRYAESLSEHGQATLVDRLASRSESPSKQLMRKERRELVRNALDHLHEMDREVLALRFLEQLPTPEAAAIQGVSENTFAQRLLRALKRLQRQMHALAEDLT